MTADLASLARGPSRAWPTFYSGFFGYMVARGCDVPMWLTSRSGDAIDIAAASAMLAYTLLGFLRGLQLRAYLMEGRDG